jgi:undecaprenyl-diphosphatase
VLAYFRHDVWQIGVGWLRSLAPGAPGSGESRLGWAIIVGTVPVVLAGLALKSLVEGDLRAPWVIAATTILFGLLLGWADRRGRRVRGIGDISLRDALIIGLSQVLALIPGTSRSGITITAGLWLGLNRASASRFSFLLSIPTILASSVLVTRDLLQSENAVDWYALGLGALLSGVTAYLAISLFLRFIERIGMWPFVIYRLLLGCIILILVY